MNLRPYLSHSGPPMRAPMAAPKALALNAARRPAMVPSSSGKYALPQKPSDVAIAMMEPESM